VSFIYIGPLATTRHMQITEILDAVVLHVKNAAALAPCRVGHGEV
jgi:hypothetical protein